MLTNQSSHIKQNVSNKTLNTSIVRHRICILYMYSYVQLLGNEEALLNTITGKYEHSSKGTFMTIQKCTWLAESSLLRAPLGACLRATFLAPPFCKNNNKEIMGGKNGGCLDLSNSLSFSSPVLSLSSTCCSASLLWSFFMFTVPQNPKMLTLVF